jgi:hypothetical protein
VTHTQRGPHPTGQHGTSTDVGCPAVSVRQVTADQAPPLAHWSSLAVQVGFRGAETGTRRAGATARLGRRRVHRPRSDRCAGRAAGRIGEIDAGRSLYQSGSRLPIFRAWWGWRRRIDREVRRLRSRCPDGRRPRTRRPRFLQPAIRMPPRCGGCWRPPSRPCSASVGPPVAGEISLELVVWGPGRPPSDATSYLSGVGEVLEEQDGRPQPRPDSPGRARCRRATPTTARSGKVELTDRLLARGMPSQPGASG